MPAVQEAASAAPVVVAAPHPAAVAVDDVGQEQDLVLDVGDPQAVLDARAVGVVRNVST
ncbi:hypothetical protein [Streptomyces longispororuber]|uniref:hypothetical protein n=1 Tax=Streptomyces longispororuber TaxID=68230 RepID=UPI00167F18CA|nr:hypothetical protein [Streptomyces longispororuber]